jgi:serine/threonine-protein kinase
MAQTCLGGLLLEAGALDDAITRLEAASALDPVQPPAADLSRAYIYAGRSAEAFALLARARETMGVFALVQDVRFRMWQGELAPFEVDVSRAPGDFQRYAAVLTRFHRAGRLSAEDLATATDHMQRSSPRLRASQGQFIAEALAFSGDLDTAMTFIDASVAAGLQDYLWLERCPLLGPLRAQPRFRAALTLLAGRAEAVLAAVRSADRALDRRDDLA